LSVPFNHQGYTVSWSPYVAQIIEPDEGQTHEEAVRTVLEYHAEKVIEKGATEKTAYVLARFIWHNNPVELCPVIDPEHHTIFFGTEAEARNQLG
jgi:hypothetical protein